MKKILTYIFILISSNVLACGGGFWEGMSFYNLFKQTNISAEAFYPFLRNEYSTFYGEDFYGQQKEIIYPKGNINLWLEILSDWDRKDIERAVYDFDNFDWSERNSEIEKQVKTYLDFANLCSQSFSYRNRINTWNYDEVLEQKTADGSALLARANVLVNKETNQQLRMRYYYQIIRIMHYSKDWDEAINFYESKIENQFPKNEMYYYILDQVAGCYYSLNDFDKAAYLFTKVLNKSWDRKKSAFISYNFCTYKNAEGRSFFTGKEDEKDLLLITSLRNFSDEISNLNKFISLDANDERVELLFMRALSNVEREIWPKYIGVRNKSLPSYENNTTYQHLLKIAEQQAINSLVQNKEFWKIISSYLSFIKQDIELAKDKLTQVNAFPEQKKNLSMVYEVFAWKELTPENENHLVKILNQNPEVNDWRYEQKNDWRHLILDKVAHTYYINKEIAKAFLVHNPIENIKRINSLELLDALEKLYNKTDKSGYEKDLLKHKANSSLSVVDYINKQKGVYYLYQKDPGTALEFLAKTQSGDQTIIPASIFSNNIKECFECEVDSVMSDEVYKADVFAFISDSFTLKDLARNLVELEKLTEDEKQWKAKLANYLLANYYYNISNTGYYRGIINNRGNCCDYNYINYSFYNYYEKKVSEEIIAKKAGYNLSDISNYGKKYFHLSTTAMQYYQNVLSLSSDKELNARCLYLMAKCELNVYYNEGCKDTFTTKISSYREITLPKYKSFKVLKEDYTETKFYEMIIKECSYFKMYSSHD
ncbi:hypothetical protein L3073_07620 [Ancylomarina sp. DW003]|nr:hypothetical protein [Ancylomarina sp. DW003]MDE5422075.1 hypothetical protein [Ancylomarina sp. DW003]